MNMKLASSSRHASKLAWQSMSSFLSWRFVTRLGLRGRYFSSRSDACSTAPSAGTTSVAAALARPPKVSSMAWKLEFLRTTVGPPRLRCMLRDRWRWDSPALAPCDLDDRGKSASRRSRSRTCGAMAGGKNCYDPESGHASSTKATTAAAPAPAVQQPQRPKRPPALRRPLALYGSM